MRPRPVVVVAVYLAPLIVGTARAADGRPERLPEPALQFAREAARALADEERAWQQRALESESLAAAVPESGPAGTSLQDRTAELLTGTRKVLAAYREVDRDLRRFRSALEKTAARYREVGELYAAEAPRAKSASVQADYRALADAYLHEAAAAEARTRATELPAIVRERAALLEECSHFLERFAEATAAVPLAEANERLLATRLDRHRERCAALAGDLVAAARALLAESADSRVRPAKQATVAISNVPPQPAVANGPVARAYRPPATAVRSSFPVRYIRPTGDWAGLDADPAELAIGQELTLERPGAGPVGRLCVESYSHDAHLAVVRALRGARFAEGDLARR